MGMNYTETRNDFCPISFDDFLLRYNFCKAARKAFLLLAANVLRVAAINSVGTFVLFLGKV